MSDILLQFILLCYWETCSLLKRKCTRKKINALLIKFNLHNCSLLIRDTAANDYPRTYFAHKFIQAPHLRAPSKRHKLLTRPRRLLRTDVRQRQIADAKAKLQSLLQLRPKSSFMPALNYARVNITCTCMQDAETQLVISDNVHGIGAFSRLGSNRDSTLTGQSRIRETSLYFPDNN